MIHLIYSLILFPSIFSQQIAIEISSLIDYVSQKASEDFYLIFAFPFQKDNTFWVRFPLSIFCWILLLRNLTLIKNLPLTSLAFAPLIAAAILLVFVLSFLLSHWTYRNLFFVFDYGPVKKTKGLVSEDDHNDFKSTPAKPKVVITYNYRRMTSYSPELCNRVAINEPVNLYLQTRFSRPRFWSGNWRLDQQSLIKIENIKGKVVNFNKAQPENSALE